MPNQENFRSDITTVTDNRFSASRIVRVPDEVILYEEVPASFGFDNDDSIELHFYTSIGNQLILSTTINLSDDIIKSHIVSYQDGTYKNYIRVDFTKLFVDKQLLLVPGDYRMVLNFFSNEIGSYNNRKLNLEIISDSRTEVQLAFSDTVDDVARDQNLYLLKEFVEKGFNKADAVGVAEKIFTSGVELNNSEEGLTSENVELNIETPLANQTASNTIDRIQKIGLKEIFDEQLENFLLQLFSFVREEIIIKGDDRIQESELQQIIENVVSTRINEFRRISDSRIQVS